MTDSMAFSPQGNYTDFATADAGKILPSFAGSLLRGQRSESLRPLISDF
jgi:hypothetical protein